MKSSWRFDYNPLVEDPGGPFLEVPIAHHRVSHCFYLRHAFSRYLGRARYQSLGNGIGITPGHRPLIKKLLRRSSSVVSVNGFKDSSLSAAAVEYKARGDQDLLVIGHPMSLTPYSLEKIGEFLESGLVD